MRNLLLASAALTLSLAVAAVPGFAQGTNQDNGTVGATGADTAVPPGVAQRNLGVSNPTLAGGISYANTPSHGTNQSGGTVGATGVPGVAPGVAQRNLGADAVGGGSQMSYSPNESLGTNQGSGTVGATGAVAANPPGDAERYLGGRNTVQVTPTPTAEEVPPASTMPTAQPGTQPAPMPEQANSGPSFNGSWTPGHEPLSHQASNIVPGDTSSTVAPRLPAPGVGPDATPGQLLSAAQDALNHHASGRAQEALERAETRLLTRSTAPSAVNEPDAGPAVNLIHQALESVGHRDWTQAHQAIDQAMQTPAVQRMASAM